MKARFDLQVKIKLAEYPVVLLRVACCEYRHSGACRNPVVRSWTPDFAGVT